MVSKMLLAETGVKSKSILEEIRNIGRIIALSNANFF